MLQIMLEVGFTVLFTIWGQEWDMSRLLCTINPNIQSFAGIVLMSSKKY